MDSWNLALSSNYGLVLTDIWGRNPDVDTGGNPETLWDFGGLYTWQSGTEGLYVVSSSSLDNVAGTGARSVTVTGLDSNYDTLVETVGLSGTTPVNLTGSFLRVNKMVVASAGSAGRNSARVSLQRQGDGLMRGVIPTLGGVGTSVGLCGRYTVPNNKALVVTLFQVNVIGDATGDRCTVGVFTRRNDVSDPPWVMGTALGTAALGSAIHDIDISAQYIKFLAKQDVEFRSLESTNTNLAVQMRMRGVLITPQS